MYEMRKIFDSIGMENGLGSFLKKNCRNFRELRNVLGTKIIIIDVKMLFDVET